ncbi:DUF1835 domain-containing protein [Aureisphaera sp.]
MANTLHLTNGSSFTERLKLLLPNEEVLTWNEILCEGPASYEVFSEPFVEERITYLRHFDPSPDKQYAEFVTQFNSLEEKPFESIILWFEYDLFCHINMAAAITYLFSKWPNVSLFLVCSGHIAGKEGLYGLSELSKDDLWKEYENKLLLDSRDKEVMKEFWNIYCQENHSRLNELQFNEKKFPYLSECILTHFSRFPNSQQGLNALELKVLNAIHDQELDSTHKLIGHLLRNQGYFGFGDVQWAKVIDRMSLYFERENRLQLNEKGNAILEETYSATQDLQDDTLFGRCAKYDYLYNPTTQGIEKR